MAAANQETVEEDASDLVFPKETKWKQDVATKTLKVIEKFPSPEFRTEFKYAVNYLLSISGSYWFMYNPSRKSIYVGMVGQVFGADMKESGSKSAVKELAMGGQSIVEWEIKRGIPFDPSHLVVHPEQPGLCALWGKKGLVLVNIPIGKKKERLDYELVAEDLFIEDMKLEVLQVRWYPLAHQKLVAVLFNDQIIRMYSGISGEIFTGSVSLPAARAASLSFRELEENETEIPVNDKLVDIDFGPLLPKSNYLMLFMLLESGQLYYILIRALDGAKRCYTELHGPLKFNEETADPVTVLGSRCTSLVCSKQFPIVIATGDISNTLKHYIVLPDEIDSEEYNLEENILANDLTVFLREKIILETIGESETSSVVLVADPMVDSRYACVTDTGLYFVSIDFMKDLRAYLQEDEPVEGLKSTPSRAQFLICWKISDSSKTGKCLAGLSFSDPLDDKLLVVLGNLKGLAIDIGNYDTSTAEIRDSVDSPNNKVTAFPNDMQDILKTVTNILRRSSAQPFMCSNEELDGDELLKFTCEAIDLLTTEYIERQEEAANYLACSVNTLKVKKATLAENIQELKIAKADLRAKAESIAEQYEESLAKMEEFKRRLNAILVQQHKTLPDLTDEEKRWMGKLDSIKAELETYKQMLTNLKEKSDAEKYEFVEDARKAAFKMGPSQIRELKNQLSKHTETISNLNEIVTEIRRLQGSN